MFELFFSLSLLVVLVSVIPRRYQPTILSAYVLRLILCYFHAYVIVLPDSQFDAIAFERIAWQWAHDGQCLSDFTTGSRLYSWIASCIYVVVGRSALVLQVVNAFLGAMIVLVAMKTVRVLVDQGIQYRLVGWTLALHPSLLLYSAITMREVAIVLSFSLSIYWFVKWIVTERYHLVSWAILWMLVSQLFHTGMVTGTLVMSFFVAYYTVTRHWFKLVRIRVFLRDVRASLLSLGLVLLLSIGLSTMVSHGYGLDKLQSLRTERVLVVLADWQERSARGRASYLGGQSADEWPQIVLQGPIRLAHFLGAPFAWQISRLRDLWGFVDGMFLIVLTMLALRDVGRGVWRRKGYFGVAVLLVATIVGFATVTSNYGTAFRHRAKFVPAIVVLYAYGRSERSWRTAQGGESFGGIRAVSGLL